MIGLSLYYKVMLGTALLGGMAGVAGTFAVLRKRSLVGDMLAHTALPGVCVAFMVLGTRSMIGLSVGALISGLIAIAMMTVVVRWTRTKEDAAIGIMLSTFFGLGIVLLTDIQHSEHTGNQSGLDSYIFGEPGNMLTSDLITLAAIAVVVLLLVFALFKEFKLVSFDSDFALSQGWPIAWLDYVMMAAVAVVTIVGLPIVGVILMAAMIILPAATARLWTNRLHTMVLLASMFGVAAGVLGTWLGRGLPAGPAIVLVAASIFYLSLLFAPQRGIVSRLWGESQLRIRIAREHMLRSLYEIVETQLPEIPPVKLATLQQYRHWRPWLLKWLLDRCEANELLYETDDAITLTPLGVRRAAEVTKTHRMWELYMLEYAGVAPRQADKAADHVEHMLPESLLLELETKLKEQGRLPTGLDALPESPHALAGDGEHGSSGGPR
ncbi:metal ABC transporter permease [Adhaeretor mobilis]|uniref:Manganese transport system membrane protein MntB n=1 Tax=Adhaeretor mobilis TaxID=1930276 RepID=A0A517MWY9_9BACT|nr:iron chelate uptake ABC transporter family permease subunit [Adhaeretor mobilis]QDS99391.1 Manganese transport system membrane protein MntB [Adhaeretor mobilis]